jgi:UDP-N-acetylglucosamine diphosphorylase/glucosamine-1-phosphate N-acetyltransferase
MLASGMSTLLDKQVRYLSPTRLTLWVRPGLEAFCRQQVVPHMPCPTAVNEPLNDEEALLVSGRTLHMEHHEHPGQPAVVLEDEGAVMSAIVRRPGLGPQDAMQRTAAWLKLSELPQSMPQCRMVSYLWDLIRWNEESMVDDWAYAHRTPGALSPHKPAGPYHVIEDQSVNIDPSAKIGAGVVLDGSSGPVIVAASAKIGANAVLRGPCFIGAGAEIAPLTLVRPGTSIGTMCRIGGEISNTIVMGYTNKAHEGYLGDSYLGQWINIGAGTFASNRKNTYGLINVQMGKHSVSSGMHGLGSLIGDHSKTAIGTRLMTGTYVGYCCSVALSQMAPHFVPSFSFLTDKGAQKYDQTKALEVMRTVYSRRDRVWTDADTQTALYAAKTAPSVEEN